MTAVLVGAAVAVLVFAVLSQIAVFLFTGGGIIVASLIAYVAGTVAASYVRPAWATNSAFMVAVVLAVTVLYMVLVWSAPPTGPTAGASSPAR